MILRIKINSVSSAGSWVENPGYSTIRSLRKRPQLADVVDIPPGRGASVGDGNLLVTADKSLDGRSGHYLNFIQLAFCKTHLFARRTTQ